MSETSAVKIDDQKHERWVVLRQLEEWIEIPVPPIISEDLFDQVQEVLVAEPGVDRSRDADRLRGQRRGVDHLRHVQGAVA